MTTDLNALYDKGDLCWLLVSSVLCWCVALPRRSSSLDINIVQADYTGYRLPVRWDAQEESCIDYDIPVPLLRLRRWYTVLGLWILALPVTHHWPLHW